MDVHPRAPYENIHDFASLRTLPICGNRKGGVADTQGARAPDLTVSLRILNLRFAFDRLDLHRLALEVYAFNERAIATYRRCGFIEEADSGMR